MLIVLYLVEHVKQFWLEGRNYLAKLSRVNALNGWLPSEFK